jgi:hypothetical protein
VGDARVGRQAGATNGAVLIAIHELGPEAGKARLLEHALRTYQSGGAATGGPTPERIARHEESVEFFLRTHDPKKRGSRSLDLDRGRYLARSRIGRKLFERFRRTKVRNSAGVRGRNCLTAASRSFWPRST